MSTSSVDSSVSSAVYSSINAANQAGSKSAKSASGDTMSAAQDTFLKLLTTQLKNQDPLNPLDNAQMTSQLAQISTVDGITKLNATMQAMLTSSSDSQTLQAAALVGHAVLVPGNGLALKSGQSIGGVDLSGPADSVVASIRDANGILVRTLDLGAMDAGASNFTWDGTSDSGAIAADGQYRVSFTAKQGSNKVTAAALQYAPVTSVAKNSQGVSLTVGNLGTVTLSDVKQIV